MLKSSIRPVLVVFSLLSVLTGLLYPLVITGLGSAVFADRAGGSLIMRDGKVIGSRLIGQSFTGPQYFWGRPSATSGRPYNPQASGGSNQGPLNPALLEAVKSRIDSLRAADPANQGPVPVDLVAASGSGLDPHISVAAAKYQAGRVAQARSVPVERIQTLISEHVEGRWLGLFGEPQVNVLTLNLALDELMAPGTSSE
jgi:potassium-transporting ATPase KdpC subunit